MSEADGGLYLYVLFLAVCVFLLWTLHTLTFAENANQTFEVWLFMPSWRGEAMGTSVRYPMSLPLLLAGWATVGCGICFLAWRLPARIRRSASTQRELRALRRQPAVPERGGAWRVLRCRMQLLW